MLSVPTCLMGAPINLTGDRFTNGTGLSESILYFTNRTTGRWSAIYFNITECAAEDTSIIPLSTSFSLYDYVDLL